MNQKPLFGFPHISKTGGTTILTMLRSSFGTAHCDVEAWRGKHGKNFKPNDLKRLLKIYPHLKSVSGHAFHPYEDCETVRPIRYFAMFREPISRCISEYQHQLERRGKDWSFDRYIRTVGFNSQTRFICGEPDHKKAIEVIQNKSIVCGLLEHFDESLMIFNKIVFHGQLNCSYSIKKSAKKNDIRNQILKDQNALALIDECNQEDIKLYQWIKAVHYPKHKEDYGHSLEKDLANFAGAGFNRFNIFLNRCYRNAVYKPCLKAARLRGVKDAERED